MQDIDVLVIEDEAQLRDIIVAILRRENFSVIEASDGAEALAMVQSGSRPTLALCDITMPNMNGLDFVRESLKIHPKLGVVMLTAHNENAKILDALRLGALDYIIKPFNNNALVETIYGLLHIAKLKSGETLKDQPQERRAFLESLMRIKNANSQRR